MKRLFFTFTVLCLGIFSAGAQHPWMQTGNAAGTAFGLWKDGGAVNLSAIQKEGKLRPVQEASSSTAVIASTYGTANVGKVRLYGDFAFRNIFDRGLSYNTNLYRTALDMPYYILDPNESNWTRQEYDMNVKASIPIGERFAAGLSVNYLDCVGAKQKDPRSETYLVKAGVCPGVVWKPSKKHTLGISGDFLYSYERAYPSNNNPKLDQKTISTLGLGEGANSYVGGNNGLHDYHYTLWRFGGAVQYSYSGSWNVISELGVRKESTEVIHKISLPESMGRTDRLLFHAMLEALSGPHSIKVNGSFRTTDGTEKIQVKDNTALSQGWITVAQNKMSRYNHASVLADYSFTFPTSLSIGALAVFDMESDVYNIPVSTFGYSRIRAGAYASRRFQIRKSSLNLRADAGYTASLGGDYVYGGSKTDSPAVALYRELLDYYTSSYASAAIAAAYIFGGGKLRYSVSGDASILAGPSGKNYFTGSLSLGILF